MTDQQPKELRLSRGKTILGYIRIFSATEKAVFGIFVILAVTTALIMAEEVNSHFMKEVPARGGTLREGLVGLPHTVNPVLAVTDADKDISSLVYAGLTRYSSGKVVHGLASSWTVSPDGLTYDFTLRPGLTFQDGSPLTSADVVFTIDKIQDPVLKSPLYPYWAGVEATTTSPVDVEFTLKQPYGSFPAYATVGIMPKHIWGNVSDDQFIFSQYNIEPVGAGPFKPAGIDRDGSGIPVDYRLSAWNGYAAGPEPYLSNIVFTFFQDQSHAITAIENGSIDSLPSVPLETAANLSTDSGEPYTVISSPLYRVFGVFFDQSNNAVLSDSSVRQALSMSVDRPAMVADALYGYGVPLSGPLPPGLASASNTSPVGPDIASAEALLQKDGWRAGVAGIMAKKSGKAASTTLAFTLYTANAPDLKQTAQMLSDEWGRLGASVTVKTFDPGDLYQSVIKNRSYDALLFGEALDKDGNPYPFWDSSERNFPGLNLAMYASSKADKILESLQGESSSTARLADYAALESQISTDVPAVFLYAPDFTYAVPKSLRGIDLGPIASPEDRFDSVSSWYLETERVYTFIRP